MSDIPELDSEAAKLAQLIDAVLGDKTATPRNQQDAKTTRAAPPKPDAANSSDGAMWRADGTPGRLNKTDEQVDPAGRSVTALREALATLMEQREQILGALEDANRKAAIGELSAELEDLAGELKEQLVRYSALMHLVKGTPFGPLNIASLYGAESIQRAQRMVAEIRQGWRQG